MPKKNARKVQYHKDNRKRRMRRALTQRLRRLSLREFTFKTCEEPDFDSQSEMCEFINMRIKRKSFKKIGQPNLIQSLHYPVSTDCVFSLYGMITIDESALRSESKDQSLIKALFNFYSINQVQINQDYLLVKIYKSKQNYLPISYIIERFNSYGDLYFYQMAQKIEQIRQAFDQMAFKSNTNLPMYSDKQINQFIQHVKGKKAMLRVAPNCMVFTKQLLSIGDHSLEEVGAECLKYRSFVTDIFLADNYRGEVNKFFQLYQLSKKFRRGQLKQEVYSQLSRQNEVEYIMDSKSSLIKIRTSKYNLAPGVACWEAQELVTEDSLLFKLKKQETRRKKQFIQQLQLRRVDTLAKLAMVGRNHSKDNEKIICSYLEILNK